MQSSQNLVDAERVDHIVRIDTGALLNVIRELEIKLSDHHRQVEHFPDLMIFTYFNDSHLLISLRIRYLRGRKL